MRWLLLLALALPAQAERQTALTAKVVLKVVSPGTARVAIRKALDRLGAFPILVTDDLLTLKLPPDGLRKALRLIAQEGIVVEKTRARADLTRSITQMEAQLRSKAQIFDRLRALVDDSDVKATLQIERNMSSLLQEMEALQGRLRVERERARHAVIEVAFRFRKRDRVKYVRSPFDWLNSVDLGGFVGRF